MSMGEPPAEESAAQKIESAAPNMSKAGKQLAAQLLKYIEETEGLNNH